MALWSLFLPLAATPVSCSGFAGGIAVAPVSSPETLATAGYGLLDLHLGVAKADSLGFAAGASPDNKLLRTPWGAPGAVTR